MYPFSRTRASGTREALDSGRRGGRYIVGGTTLVDLMRETVERPGSLVDISGLPLRGITVTERGGLRIGALESMASTAATPKARALYPGSTGRPGPAACRYSPAACAVRLLRLRCLRGRPHLRR
ncbi:molybdopterin dehydrogenase FAD-binding protein [Actinobacteria bacterium OK074]|nr:molybdopterin dehydrogenase FAD-binding protein [Actinobacteria bacterium OK074]